MQQVLRYTTAAADPQRVAEAKRLKSRRATLKCALRVRERHANRAVRELQAAAKASSRAIVRVQQLKARRLELRAKLRAHPRSKAAVCALANASSRLKDAQSEAHRLAKHTAAAGNKAQRADNQRRDALVKFNRVNFEWQNLPNSLRQRGGGGYVGNVKRKRTRKAA